MQLTRTLAVTFILTGGLLLSSPPSRAAPQDPLWLSAVARKDTGGVWLPGTMIMREEELDGKGVTKSSGERWMGMKDLGDGTFAYETFKIVEDGKEVQAGNESEDKDKNNGQSEPGSYTFSVPDIFDSEAQDRVTVKPLGQRKQIGGRECIGYEFVTERDQKSYRETLTSLAWLEEHTGIPVELKYTARPLPKRVKRAESTVHYGDAPDGSFYPIDLITEGTGGFLVFKKHFRITLKLLEYRQHHGK